MAQIVVSMLEKHVFIKHIIDFRKISIFLLLVFLLLMAKTGNAQEQGKIWTLRDCIEYALENNIQIKKQMLGIESYEEDLFQSKMNLLPDLNGYASHGYNWGQTIDRFTNQFATDRVRSNNFYASSSITLFNGFQKMNTIKINQLRLMATRYNSDKFMDDISIEIATYFLQVLYYQEYVDITGNQLEITMQQVERTKKLVDAGTLAKGDLLTVEARAATEEFALVEAQNNLDISLLTLTQLLELPSPQGFKIEKPDLGLLDPSEALLQPEDIFKIAVDKRPNIKSAELNVESAQKSVSLAKGSLSPNLYLSGSWGTGYSGANEIGEDPVFEDVVIGATSSGELVHSSISKYSSYNTKPFGDQLEDNNNQTVNLAINIPVFNGWQSRNSIAKAKIALESAEYDLQYEKNTLYKIIQQAYADATAANNQYNSALKKVNATNESYKYAEQKFNVGLINSVDYNDAKKEYTNAQSELLQAKFDYVFKTTVLDFYMGKPLSLKK